jgi:hypothetical protein
VFANPGSSTTYAAVGYEHNGRGNAIENSGLVIAYDAASNTYLAGYPGGLQSRLDERKAGDNDRFVGTTSADNAVIYRTGPANPELNLTYSSLLKAELGSPWDYTGGTFVAFGRATPAGGTPITGSATYNGVAYGQTLSTAYDVRGSVQLNFDFAAGALSGYFDPLLVDTVTGSTLAQARATFANTVFARGGQTFSGTFAGVTGSTFNGQFTGPAAQEFIGRFIEPLTGGFPGDAMVGVWVGKR